MRATGLFLFLFAGGPLRGAACKTDRDDLLTRPLAGEGPTTVYVHLLINDIVAIPHAEQSFSSDIFMRLEWHDPRLAHTDTSHCAVGLNDIWWPDLQIMNRRTGQNIRDVNPLVGPDGSVSMLLRGFGDFSIDADLSDFRFDRQQLYFDIVSIYGPDEIDYVYHQERMSLGDRLSVANFSITISGVQEMVMHVGSTQQEHARLLVTMDATRLTGFYTWQQLLPLVLVVMMAWIVFWIPREHVPSRIGLAATSMLTLIAHRFAMSSVLPPIAYLTRLDRLMIGASVLVFLALAAAVAVTYIMDLVDEALADRINLAARWLVPLLLTLVSWLAFAV